MQKEKEWKENKEAQGHRAQNQQILSDGFVHSSGGG